jgi:hypothetical protein
MYQQIRHRQAHVLEVVDVTALVAQKAAVVVLPLTIEFRKAHILQWHKIDSPHQQHKHKAISQAMRHPQST